MTLPILFQNNYIVAVSKPANMLVHRGEKASHGTTFVLQTLRDQLGQTVYPVHRLDKATSGVLVMAKSSEVASELASKWADVDKHYIALVRGFVDGKVLIDQPLAQPRDRANPNWQPGPEKPAQTWVEPVATVELPLSIDKYPTSRYSLVDCQLLTGRKHQIRRHLRHIGHPILCDTRYGKNRHYHYFRDQFDVDRMLLHAYELSLPALFDAEAVRITAPLDSTFGNIINRFEWQQTSPLGNSYLQDLFAQ